MVSNVFTLCTLALASLAAAYSKAQGPNPIGNPLTSPATGEIVAAGKSYTIKWTPTTEGTVTLYLCLGPSTNCVNEAVPFADHVPNTGSFVWSVPATLPAAASGHGIQLVVDEGPNFGQYQYTGQFGISNAGYVSSSSMEHHSSSSHSASASAYPSSSTSTYPSSLSAATTITSHESLPTYTLPANLTSTRIYPTASVPGNSSVVLPTQTSMFTFTPVPTGNSTATGVVPVPTGAAARVAGGVGLSFAAVAAAFFAL